MTPDMQAALDADAAATEWMRPHPARIHRGFKDTVTITRSFTLAEFAEVAARNSGFMAGEKIRRAKTGTFYGTTTSDALRMARGAGWPEGRDDAARIAMHLTRLTDASTMAETFEYAHDVTGGTVDIGAFMAGEHECMMESVPAPVARRGKVARLVVPFAFASAINTDVIRKRGAGVVALMDALATAHYSLEVWAIDCHTGASYGQSDGWRTSYAVKVTEAGGTYRPDLMAYVLGHASFRRRIGFLVANHEGPEVRARFGTGRTYGYASDACVDDLPPECQDGPAIVLPHLSYFDKDTVWSTDEGIARWIEDAVGTITAGE